MFGIQFCNIDYAELCRRVDERIALREPGFIVTPNVDHVCRFHRNAEFRLAYQGASQVVADGVPLLWCSRILGRPLREKLSGADLLPWLTAYAARRGYSVFYLGAAEGVAEEVARRMRESHPDLKVAGTYSPPMGFEHDAEAREEVLQRLREARPDICFVALGSPKQEVWIHDNYASAEVPVMIGVGAAFDFAAGRLRRAPRWMQKIGLEWFWRLLLEPRRLAPRYFLEDSYFLVLLWREMRKKARRGRLDPKTHRDEQDVA